MPNEILLILSIPLIFFTVIIMYKLFAKNGLYCFMVIATIAANIEVLIIVKAFGLEMTLGNVLFASTFLCTDIISEVYGKEDAKKAVKLGIATSIIFVILSQVWLLYSPAKSDFIMPSMKIVFNSTTRVIIVGMIVYAIVQFVDVFLYHKIWELTTKKFGDKKSGLWIRNNLATLISQLFNAILFNLGAFFGVVSTKTMIQLIITSYVIFIVTSIADTPFVYLARKLKVKE